MRCLLGLLAACGSSAAALDAPASIDAAHETHALAMGDVSILLPLPGDLAKPVIATLTGMIPANLFVSLVSEDIAPKVGAPPALGDFQIVAVRFDLCDRSTIGTCPSGVDGRLRLVLQPLYVSGGVTLGNDIGIHAFYPIPATELAGVITELRALARIQDAPDAPLGVSPAATAGNVEYLGRLRALVLRYARADRLVRITVIGQEAESAAFAWIFKGYDRSGANFTSMVIPGTVKTHQTAQLTGGDVIFNMEPVLDQPVGFALAINGTLFAQATPDAQFAAVEALTVIQNPRVHDAVDTQCVACHVSTYLIPHRTSAIGIDPTTLAGRFTTPYDTTVDSIAGTDPRVIRGFGWAAGAPAISQRVANDTAEVLTEIEQRFPVR